MSDKETVLEVVRGMPEATTLDEIVEQISILAAIRRGERAADTGQVVSHEEMKRRAAAWVSN